MCTKGEQIKPGVESKKTETIMEDEESWQCPNCGEFWSIGEFDAQRCGSCGYPDYDADDDELN